MGHSCTRYKLPGLVCVISIASRMIIIESRVEELTFYFILHRMITALICSERLARGEGGGGCQQGEKQSNQSCCIDSMFAC